MGDVYGVEKYSNKLIIGGAWGHGLHDKEHGSMGYYGLEQGEAWRDDKGEYGEEQQGESKQACVRVGKCESRQVSQKASVTEGKCHKRQVSQKASVTVGKCHSRQVSQ